MSSYLDSLKNDPLRSDAFHVAVEVLLLCRTVTVPEFALIDQLRRSIVSVGSNLNESHGAETRLLCGSKLAIAYRECQEARFQLEILAVLQPSLRDQINAIDRKLDSLSARMYVGIRKLRATRQPLANPHRFLNGKPDQNEE